MKRTADFAWTLLMAVARLSEGEELARFGKMENWTWISS